MHVIPFGRIPGRKQAVACRAWPLNTHTHTHIWTAAVAEQRASRRQGLARRLRHSRRRRQGTARTRRHSGRRAVAQSVALQLCACRFVDRQTHRPTVQIHGPHRPPKVSGSLVGANHPEAESVTARISTPLPAHLHTSGRQSYLCAYVVFVNLAELPIIWPLCSSNAGRRFGNIGQTRRHDVIPTIGMGGLLGRFRMHHCGEYVLLLGRGRCARQALWRSAGLCMSCRVWCSIVDMHCDRCARRAPTWRMLAVICPMAGAASRLEPAWCSGMFCALAKRVPPVNAYHGRRAA